MQVVQTQNAKGAFFKVLAGTDLSQVAAMTVEPGNDSGPEEIHSGDQIVYVVESEARVTLNGEEGRMHAGDIVIIPKGAKHHIYNNGAMPLFFITMYAPPQY